MRETASLQIQSVIYNNSKKDLVRTFDNIFNALDVSKKNEKPMGKVVVHYGDASKAPLFSIDEVAAIQDKYKNFFDFRYTFFGFNSGTSKGHNLLAKEVSSDFLLLMNPDIIVSPKFFIYMMEPFQNQEIGMVEARQTPIEHPKRYNRITGEVDWASGACGIVRTEVFRALNGYDEKNFFLYCDDVDLSWRIRLAGYKIVYQPLAAVFHAKSLSSAGEWKPTDAEVYYSAESALLMTHKWSNPKLCNEILHNLLESKNDISIKAANSFIQKEKDGQLPSPLDPEHKVSKFVKGNYTEHRFVL